MCIIFPITVRLLQNNERGFPLIFTITVVELGNIFKCRCFVFADNVLRSTLQPHVHPD